MDDKDRQNSRKASSRDRARAEGSRLGLKYGDTHPQTGMVFTGSDWASPAAFSRTRLRDFLRNSQTRAREKGLPCDLTVAWLKAVWPPNGRCEVLPEIVLQWGDVFGQPSSPSIDRIRPDLGYVQTNCRIISMRANTLKSNATRRELEAVLADLIKHESAD